MDRPTASSTMPSAPAPDELALGKQALTQNDPRQAIEHFNRQLEQTPNHLPTLAYRSVAYQALQQWQNQIADLQRLIRSGANDPINHYHLAQARVQLEQFDQAMDDLNRALALNPQLLVAYQMRALIHEKKGRTSQAIEDWMTVHRVAPDDVPTRLALARYAIAAAQYQTALKYLDTTIPAMNAMALVWDRRGFALLRLQRFDEAEQAIAQARKLAPDWSEPQHTAISLLIERKQFAQAEQQLDQLARAHPNEQGIAGLRGVICARSGRDAQAVEYYSQALAICPNSKDYWNRGNALARLNRMTEAEADFIKALEMAPDNSGIYCDRGTARFNHDQLDGALQDYEKAIALAPADSLGYLLRAGYWLKKGDSDRALMDANRAMELDPDRADCFRRRGDVYVVRKEFDAALADYNRLLAIRPDADTVMDRGNIFAAKNDLLRAIADYQQAIVWNPQLASAHLNLALAYNRLKDFDKALEAVNREIELFPRHWKAISCRGRFLLEMGNFDAALKDLNLYLGQNPSSAYDLMRRAEIYQHQKCHVLAEADLNRAIQIKPDEAEFWNRRGLLYEKAKNYQRSFDDYTQAQKLDPSMSSPYFGRAFIWIQTGNAAAAIEELGRLIAVQPALGEAYRRRAIYHAAARHLQAFEQDAAKAQELGNPLDQATLQQLRQHASN